VISKCSYDITWNQSDVMHLVAVGTKYCQVFNCVVSSVLPEVSNFQYCLNTKTAYDAGIEMRRVKFAPVVS